MRNQVSLSALEGLMVKLGGLREGRKAVILVSEGYSNYLPPQLRDPVAEMPGMGNPMRRRSGYGDGSVAEERKQFFDDIDIQNDMREVFNAANRGNTAIYALDPRGLAVFEFDINEGVGGRIDRAVLNNTMATLQVLSEETDGRAIVNRNDLEGGLKQVVRDSSAYYLLGYNSTQAPVRRQVPRDQGEGEASGRCRSAPARATGRSPRRRPRGPRPRPSPVRTRASPRRWRRCSSQSASAREVIRTWIGTGPAENGKSRVTFVWEPVPPAPGARAPRRADAPVADGRRRGRAGLLPRQGAAGRRGRPPIPGRSSSRSSAVEFDSVPGRIQLRYAVEGASGQTIDSDVIDVVVPDYTAPQVPLTTPQVIRARTAIEVRQFNANPNAVPVAEREFRRTERLLIRFSAPGPGTETPETVGASAEPGGPADVRPSRRSPSRAPRPAGCRSTFRWLDCLPASTWSR